MRKQNWFLVFVIWALCLSNAQAQGLIRDTEIEATLRNWLVPLAEQAGVSPNSISIYIVNDDRLNAFVAGGANIFFHTGLLVDSENAGEVVGVMAHELGHIAGGHLIRGQDALNNAVATSLISTLLGIGAAIATGDGQAAQAFVLGGQALAGHNFLAHSRVQESSADQAALTYLSGARLDASGVVSFLEQLQNQELLPASQQSAYIRTHPLTRDRIETIIARIKKDSITHQNPSEWSEHHARMKAKLAGFLHPQQVNWLYPEEDKDIASAYAHAIANYRQGSVAKALAQMDALILREPDNPYFYELKGQILRDDGHLKKAQISYQKALQYLPAAPLIEQALAHVLIEQKDSDYPQAIQLLNHVIAVDKRNPPAYRLLATAYGRIGNEGAASLYLGEESIQLGRYRDAHTHIMRSLDQLDPEKDKRLFLRARDAQTFLDHPKIQQAIKKN